MMRFFKARKIIISFMLIAVMAFMIIACDKGKTNVTEPVNVETGSTSGLIEVGEGAKSFLFDVVEKEGKETHYQVKTDETTVGAALLANNLIEGDVGEYGLYVKKVLGIEADYDKTGTYWAFYIGDEYASSGVDTTDIVEGTLYKFKVEQ